MAAIGLLFPGQGAQKPGMGGDLAEGCEPVRRVFQIANERLGLELDRICFEGPDERLARSDVAQPAILTVSVASLRALEEQAGTAMPPVAGSAGLSLGEYTALVAAGALAFEDAVEVVRHRGIYMQEACDANPGTMCSILGLEDEQVEESCARAREEVGEGVWPANYNCPGQLVISGREKAVEEAARLCAELGARRTIRLNVAGAFHTELMRSAAEKLAPVLDETEFHEPSHPVVANVTGCPVKGPDEIRRRLIEQVHSPVRWRSCMEWFLGQDVERFYEVGPGSVLRGLLRRIDRSAACAAVSDASQVADVASDWQKGDTA